MRYGVVALSAGCILGLAVAQGWAEPPAPAAKPNPDQWMQIKLSASEEVFKGLTGGDFKKIEMNARRLLVMNIMEQWSQERKEFKHRSEYEGQLNAFEFATKELIRTSKDHDIDGALKAYMGLTQSCVECHKLLRDAPTSK